MGKPDGTADDLRARFARLGAPMPLEKVQWRQDGKPITRGATKDGKPRYFARFVAYIDPRAVQQRLDEVFPGDWSLSQTLLPERGDEDGVPEVSMKASLSILGLSRECVGSGSNYKNAASDSFKRAAVRFGVGAELYDLETNWVEVDSDGKYAKAVEDPADAYARRFPVREADAGRDGQAVPLPTTRASAGEVPPGPAEREVKYADMACPDCGGRMYDNRLTKKGRQPDFKCAKSPRCDGAVWLDSKRTTSSAAARTAVSEAFPEQLIDPEDDGLPF